LPDPSPTHRRRRSGLIGRCRAAGTAFARAVRRRLRPATRPQGRSTAVDPGFAERDDEHGPPTARLEERQRDLAARERELAVREQQFVEQRAALVQLVSHELRTPLTVIRGGVDTLRARPNAVGSDFRDLLEATARSTRRLEQLVDQALVAAGGHEARCGSAHDGIDHTLSVEIGDLGIDAPHVREREREIVELRTLVLEVAGSVEPDLSGRLELDVPENARLVTVQDLLAVALRCLLDNAAKFAPVDSPVEVTCRRRRGSVLLRVRDHGPGLPSGFERTALEPFTQADTSLVRQHQGVGLGLYTASRLARRLGGELDVSSSGAGMTAELRLPQAEDAAVAGTAVSA
jgi:signal transduction histidine kinase